MMEGWNTTPLGELVDPSRGISYGIVQPGDNVPNGIPIIRVSDLKGDRLNIDSPMRVRPEIEAPYSRTRLRGRELIMSIVGTVGQTAIIDKSLAGWNVARAIAVIPVQEEIGAYWVQLSLRAGPAREHIGIRLNTTVQATLNLRDLSNLPIPLPPTKERETIASVLGALDDKIELNRRMNETLERQARAIFRDWFVDFGPTRAKQEARSAGGTTGNTNTGREPYLAPEIWSLFPDRLDADGKPEGWNLSPLLDHARLISGGTPKTDRPEYWNGPIAWASAKDVSQCGQAFLIDTERGITEEGLEKSATRIVPALSTIVVARGATTGRHCMFGREIAMNQTCYALNSLSNHPYWLRCGFEALVNDLVHSAHGSVFDTITTRTIQNANVTFPGADLIDAFEQSVEPMFAQILSNTLNTRTLAETRDLLLPKLMSGEIRICDAETTVEEVV